MSEPIPFPDVTQQGANRYGFLELLYGTLFQPVKTFRSLDGTTELGGRPLLYGLFSILLSTAVATVVQLSQTGGNPSSLLVWLPFTLICGVIAWVWTALTIGLAAYAFTGKTRLRPLLVQTGLAMLPGLLLAPIFLLPQGMTSEPWSSLGTLIFAVPALLIWLWTSLLFTLAIVVTYEMNVERVFILLLLPAMMFISGVGGFFSLIGTLIQLKAS